MPRTDEAAVAVGGIGIKFDPKQFNGGNVSVTNYTAIKVNVYTIYTISTISVAHLKRNIHLWRVIKTVDSSSF